MAERAGDTISIDGSDEGAPVHRSVQELWREQNAAWRARVLGELRAVVPLQREDAARTA